MKRYLARLALTLLVVLLGGQAAAAPAATPAPTDKGTERGAEVFVLTFGPGDHPFSKFGHNAVLVVDHQRRSELVYNFGTFSSSSPSLIGDFMQGRLMYWVSVSQKASTLAAYARDNRSVVAQRLALTHAEKQRLIAKLAHSALPENRYYRYHYYLDNCSTKVRDVLNEALGGALNAARRTPAALSWRQHTSRLTQDSLWVNLGLNLLLAGGVDVASSRWQEMFLPSVLQDELNKLRRADGRPLVPQELVWHHANRSPPATTPARWASSMLLVGLAVGALVWGLARLGSHHRLASHAFLLLTGLLGTVAGLLGIIFCFFWLYTDHDLAHGNENLLLFPPWALALPIAAVGCFFSRAAWARRLRGISLVLTIGSALGLLLKAVPGFEQDNWMFLALAVPIWVMLFAATRSLATRILEVRAPVPLAKVEPELTQSPIA